MRAERLRPWHLVTACCAYWLGLAVLTLGPAVQAAWPLTRTGSHGSVALNMNDAVLSLSVFNGSTTAWSGSAHLAAIALWVGVPPLAMILLWLTTRPRVDREPMVGSRS